MSIAQAALSFFTEVRAPWLADWVWSCPLIVVTVIIHVLGLGLISQKALPIHKNIKHPRFGVCQGADEKVGDGPDGCNYPMQDSCQAGGFDCWKEIYIANAPRRVLLEPVGNI
jgi:hypothetical protein